MSKNIGHIQHIKSNVVLNGKPKLPESSALVDGEIAVNYADGYETLSIKTSSGNIATFSSDTIRNKEQETIAAALNELNTNKANAATTLSGYGITDAYTKSETSAKTEISNALSEVTKVTIEMPWYTLKDFRDNDGLIPGQWYRIIDFVTTTTQADTQSAEHEFDIIVRADDTHTLNENAYAALHSGDTYFASSKLEAWELKYCIDNDTNRFSWADTTNGKGVIYYMKDEFNNECPYDFKNIQYKLYKTTDTNNVFNGYWAIDLIDQSFPETVTIDENDYIWAYTFYYENDGTIEDTSTTIGMIEIDGGIFSNVIKECYDSSTGGIMLNKIVFCDDMAANRNFFGNSCYAMVFGYGCSQNTFGNSCYFNTFGNYCNSNMFGDNCSNNTFGNDCNSNMFGDGCSNNTFGNNCNFNTFGNACSSNIFGNDCYSNIFGNDCNSNIFGNYCNYNTLGNECKYNTFGNVCQYNTFGNHCYRIKFGSSSATKDYCQYIIVENGNRYIYLDCSATTSSSSYFRNVKIAQGVNNTTTYKTITHPTAGDTFQTEYKATNSQTILI